MHTTTGLLIGVSLCLALGPNTASARRKAVTRLKAERAIQSLQIPNQPRGDVLGKRALLGRLKIGTGITISRPGLVRRGLAAVGIRRPKPGAWLRTIHFKDGSGWPGYTIREYQGERPERRVTEVGYGGQAYTEKWTPKKAGQWTLEVSLYPGQKSDHMPLRRTPPRIVTE